jgi:hypothetical protein
MAEVAKALDTVKEKDTQKRILTWAWGKYVGDTPESVTEQKNYSRKSSRKKSKKKSSKKVTRPKKKATFSIVKDLNLKPSGKDSFNDFVDVKNPTSMVGKITVAVYYLSQVVGIDQISVDHVYTCFKWMNWKLPAQFVNMIHQAGAKGWLDTSDRDNIVLTTLGENLVEHELRAKKE